MADRLVLFMSCGSCLSPWFWDTDDWPEYDSIVISFFYWLIAACIAELASAIPSFAGVYHWAFITAGPKYGRATRWFAGCKLGAILSQRRHSESRLWLLHAGFFLEAFAPTKSSSCSFDGLPPDIATPGWPEERLDEALTIHRSWHLWLFIAFRIVYQSLHKAWIIHVWLLVA